MKTAGGAPPKYLRVAAAVRRQIADGALRPGQPAPSGAELSRVSGFSTLTCRKALKTLIADGLLVPGPSRNARPRVADPHAAALERDLADTARALSAGLAARRHAAGLTQAELAALARVSVTTVGHAETGRTWQSRRFWERADAALHADGELLRLHDNFRAASSPQHNQRSTPASIERTLASSPSAHAPAPAQDPASMWPAYPLPSQPRPAQPTPAREPRARDAPHPDDANGTAPGTPLGGVPFDAVPFDAVPPAAAPPAAAPFDAVPFGTVPFDASRAPVGAVPLGAIPLGAGPAPVGPARIVIVWTDGSVTTVHPPEVRPAPRPSSPQGASPQSPAPEGAVAPVIAPQVSVAQVVIPRFTAAKTSQPEDDPHPAPPTHER